MMRIYVTDSFDILARVPRPLLVRIDPARDHLPHDVLRASRQLNASRQIVVHGQDRDLIHSVARLLEVAPRKASDLPAIAEGDRIVVVQGAGRPASGAFVFHSLELVRCVREDVTHEGDEAAG